MTGGRRSQSFINSAPAIIAILSVIILLPGTLHNIALFLPLDVGLLTYMSIADHVNTAISILLPLLIVLSAGSIVAALILSLCYVAIRGVVVMIDRGRRSSTGRNDRGTVSGRDEPFTLDGLEKAAEPIGLLLVLSGLNALLLLLNYFIVPPGAESNFETSNQVVTGMTVVCTLAAVFTVTTELEEWPRQMTRYAVGALLVLLVPFQLGTYESIQVYRFLAGMNVRARYSVDEQSDVYFVRSTERGILFAVRTTSGVTNSAVGVIQFEPWGSLQRSTTVINQRRTDSDSAK